MGLKFVQWQINVSIHETTGQSPFKVTFEEELRIGLDSYVLPKSLVDALKAEEKIEEFLTSQEANDEDSLNRDGKTTFIKARKEATSGQTRAAAYVNTAPNRSELYTESARRGSWTCGSQILLSSRHGGLYTVGCRERKLASKFTAADLQVISENLLSIDEAPDAEIPLRTAVTKATGGQGYVKCMCISGCSSGRCSCSRKRVLCNSRCHPGKSCNNI
ncbi:hypothetical protein T03_424 [Trichinella britovi]|nr:hypothetical protein T03_424 [Trichinella britovi]